LEKQVKFLEENPAYALVGTNYRYIDEAGYPITERTLPQNHADLKLALEKTNQFAHSAVLLRLQVLQHIGGYRNVFTYAQDYDLCLRIVEKSRVYNLPETLVEWRIKLDSASVRYRPLQESFARLARVSAVERRATGRDPLAGPNPVTAELTQLQKYFKPSPVSRLRKRTIRARSYFSWAFFFRNLKMQYPHSTRYFFRCLWKSLWANPLVFLLLAGKKRGK
jgi:hypothetical protein